MIPPIVQRVLALSLFGTLISPHVLAQVQRPWWATEEFEPYGAEIAGIALAQLDSSWVSATALSDDLLPNDAFPPGERMRDHNGAFEVSRDLTGDGRIDKVIVGVYRADTGEVGRFLLALSAEGGGNWSKHSLIKLPGEARFSWLRNETNQLQWWFCFDCDNMCTVIATETGSECRFPQIGPEGPCTTFATESGIECRYRRDDRQVIARIPVAAGLGELVETREGRYFHAEIEREPLDPLWGPIIEAQLLDFFSQKPEIMRYGVPEVHCRSLTCEIQYAGYGMDRMKTTDWIRFFESGMRDQSLAEGFSRVGVVTGEQDGVSTALWYLRKRVSASGVCE